MTNKIFNRFNSNSFKAAALKMRALKIYTYIQQRNYLPVYLYQSDRVIFSCFG